MARTEAALNELSLYCDMATRHSYDQYEKHGTLLSKAVAAFRDETVWDAKWVPDDFDVCDAASHPVFARGGAALLRPHRRAHRPRVGAAGGRATSCWRTPSAT